MSEEPGAQPNPERVTAVTNCANCHLAMPAGLRFCRNCGFRLGEGSAEYTETIRFQNGHPGMGVGTTASQRPIVTTYGLNGAGVAAQAGQLNCRRRKVSGMTWIFLGLLIFFVTAGVFSAVFTPRRSVFVSPGSFSVPAPPPRSYFGVSGFESTDGGVTFENVEPPGSPADKAGLVGGDIITSFDGHPVEESDEMTELLQNTPIGQTVELTYIRDGQTKTTKLTTISKEDFDRLGTAFRNRPEGRGLFGYQDDEVERIAIPNSTLYGVKLGTIDQSRPADLAGIKKGDIIIEFDKIPIRTRAELLSRVRRALPYTTVSVKVIRDGQEVVIPVKLGKQ